jgi:TolB-like protein
VSFLGEIKRRKVFQVAAVYLVVAWLIMQVVDVVSGPLLLPDWFARVVILLLAAGFPVALILTWAFDLTPRGVVRDGGDAVVNGRRIEYVLVGLLVLAVGFLFVDKYFLDSAPDTEQVADGPIETVPSEMIAEQTTVLPNSVAVLPFENLSPDPDNAYFAAGVHEELLNLLAKISDISVISRTSVLRFEDSDLLLPEIADALNVQTIMEGSVRYDGNRVRIAAQLIDAETDEHLWSDIIEREISDIFVVQAEIAEQIAMALEAELSLEEQQSLRGSSTASSEAVRLYLFATRPFDPREAQVNQTRIQLLDEVIRIDPQFARAYAERAWHSVGEFRDIEAADLPAWERRIENDIETALDLDSTLGYAFVAKARLHRDRGQFDDAREAFENALALAPNDTEILDRYGNFLSEMEEYAQAIQLIQRAIALDPVNAELHDALGDVLFYSDNPDATAAAYRRAIQLGDPTIGARIRLGLVEMMRGDEAEALAYLRVGEYMMGAPGQLFAPALSYGYARLGKEADADRVRDLFFQRVASGETNTPSSDSLALFSLAQGDIDATLAHLKDTVEDETSGLALAGRIIKSNLFDDPVLERQEFVELRELLAARR